ncbi:hypothetical protein KKH3_08900 [Pectobacterium actinidiae]|nr:hypothetical protein KKH3_08900 [Pectobacterium actinidiae]
MRSEKTAPKPHVARNSPGVILLSFIRTSENNWRYFSALLTKQ